MILHFNVKGEKRKAMVRAVEKETGLKARYLGVPGMAYAIGDYTVGKNGELTFPDDTDPRNAGAVVDACVMAAGVSPGEWENNREAEPAESGTHAGFTVEIPSDKVNVGNLTKILEAKGNLIRKALGINDLRIELKEDRVAFPWFAEMDAHHAAAYTDFIAALCRMSKKAKRVTATEKDVENEKYAFRCFLLRLGFIGDQYKKDRKILLENLTGSTAFRNGGADHEISE